jgi:hypothetical protein
MSLKLGEQFVSSTGPVGGSVPSRVQLVGHEAGCAYAVLEIKRKGKNATRIVQARIKK